MPVSWAGRVDIGVQIGMQGHPEDIALLTWGAWVWGPASQAEAMKAQLEAVMHPGQRVELITQPTFGGTSCFLFLGELRPDELANLDDETLVERIVNDVIDVSSRLTAADDSPPTIGGSMEGLIAYFNSLGLQFTPQQIASFFTALQTKGFVILSGLSGTGKTKLAQHFADLLGGGEDYTSSLFLSVRPDWRDGRPLLGYYNPLTERYETSELLRFILDAREEQPAAQPADLVKVLPYAFETDWVKEWLAGYRSTYERLRDKPASAMSSADLQLLWQARENGIASVGQAQPIDASTEELRAATEIVQDGGRSLGKRIVDALTYFTEIQPRYRPWARTLRAVAAFEPVSTVANTGKLRSLLRRLGYGRPSDLKQLVEQADAVAIDDAFAFLSEQLGRYVPTEDVLLRAISPWLMWEILVNERVFAPASASELTPYFVILDEMNLSRVEYYFADFLSVLEGGRREDDLTREVLRLHSFPTDFADANGKLMPQDVEGRYVPPELRLPGNLCFVGTVNVDETTHSFSPKVLDRAFTIEMSAVDFTKYPTEKSVKLTKEEQAFLSEQLASVFAPDGRFAIVDKAKVADFVSRHSEYRGALEQLRSLLEPYDLHFAYRVFDEIIAFCANAEANSLWDNIGGLDAAFDQAVLMKVLPKFHGPRSKLERPLREVLAWARNGDRNEASLNVLKTETRDLDATLDLRRRLEEETTGNAPPTHRYPQTARKVVRMVQSLHAVGFASFS